MEGLPFSAEVTKALENLSHTKKGLLVTFTENARYKLFQGKEEI